MSERRTGEPIGEDDEPGSGLNLKLIYGLIVAALVVAIGIAALVVLPFYQRR